MKGDEKFTHHFVAEGYSDDCAGITGATITGQEPDEGTQCHNWFEFKIDGEVVGECIMNYDSGWQFRFRSNTHRIEAGEILRRWDGTPWQEDG